MISISSGTLPSHLCTLFLLSTILSLSTAFLPCSSIYDRLCSTLSYHHHSTSLADRAVQDDDVNNMSASVDSHCTLNSRGIIAAYTFAIPFTISLDTNTIATHKQEPIVSFLPPTAHAVQAKNEALCNTGFFTNVGAWYCTDIGNIGDEGRPRPMSKDAESSVNSLMSKFNIDGDVMIVDDKTPVGGRNSRESEDRKQNLDKQKEVIADTIFGTYTK